jgi:hypothetical protein
MKNLRDIPTLLHLSKFRVGDRVEIVYLPKTRYCGTNGFSGLVCTIEDIELTEYFTNGIGSIALKIVEGGHIIATGIVTKKVKLKLL